MRSLLDHNTPFILARHLTGHDATHASSLGWHELSNGRLLEAAEVAGYEVLITADQSIPHQQNLNGRRLALIILDTNHWPTISPHVHAVITALGSVEPGAVLGVSFPRLPLRRRLFIRPGDP